MLLWYNLLIHNPLFLIFAQIKREPPKFDNTISKDDP